MGYLLGLFFLISLPVLARYGFERRNVYIAWAVGALLGTVTCNAVSPTGRDLIAARTRSDPAQLAGTEFLFTYGDQFLAAWIGLGIGALFGAILYQPGTSPPPAQHAMKVCPFCAEQIQPAAIVCKHCGRDIPA